jgi:hypothetical protein
VTDPGVRAILNDINAKLSSPDAAVRNEAATRLNTQYAQLTGNRPPTRTLEGGFAPSAPTNPLPPIRSMADYDAVRSDARFRGRHPDAVAYQKFAQQRFAEYWTWRNQMV